MAEKASNRSARERQERTTFIKEFRDSKIMVNTHLSSNVRRVFRRHFDGLSRAAFLLRYYARMSRGEAVENELCAQILASINETNENTLKKIGVADQMLKKEGVKASVPMLEKTAVFIIDPLANYFIKAMEKSSELENKLNALWLATIITDNNRRTALDELERELSNIYSRTRALSIGVRDRFIEQKALRQAVTEAGETPVGNESAVVVGQVDAPNQPESVDVELNTPFTLPNKAAEAA